MKQTKYEVLNKKSHEIRTQRIPFVCLCCSDLKSRVLRWAEVFAVVVYNLKRKKYKFGLPANFGNFVFVC